MNNSDKQRIDFENHFFESFWLLNWFYKESKNSCLRLTLLIFTFFSLFPILIINVGIIENTLKLQNFNNGRGVLEHFGTWSLVISGPALVLIIIHLCSRMKKIITTLYEKLLANAPKNEVDNFFVQIIDILRCRTPQYKIIFYLMMSFGLFSTIVNFQNTRQAVFIYGQDVWDSSVYPLGFVVGKIFLGFLWIYLFPVIIYLACASWLCILLISNKIVFKKWLEVSSFASDGCGGFREFGNTMIVITYVEIPFISIIIAHTYTHTNFYITLLFAMVLVGVGSLAVLFLPFLKLHRFLTDAKIQLLNQLDCYIAKQQNLFFMDQKGNPNQSTLPYLSVIASSNLYHQTQKMSTWPYLPVDLVKALGPFLPSLIAIFTKIILV